jgi:hypothetical protein
MRYTVSIATIDRSYKVQVAIGDIMLYTAQRYFTEQAATAAMDEVTGAINKAIADGKRKKGDDES